MRATPRWLGRMLPMLFPAGLLLLIASNVLTFRAYLGGEPPRTRWPQGGGSPYVLRLRAPGEEPRVPPFDGFVRLQAEIGGASLSVASGVEIDTWWWRNLVLVDLGFSDRVVPIRAPAFRGASVARVDIPSHRVFLLDTGAKLREGPVFLVGDPNSRDLFLLPESRMTRLGGIDR